MPDAASPVLELPQVTVCAVASRDPEPALRALCRSMAHIRFGAVKLLSSRAVAVAPAVVEQVEIPAFPDISHYSTFMMKSLHTHIDTSHVLVVQWDGFVADPACWEPAFLDHDYVGAPWPQFTDGANVGNGGFSLRSRRLIEATAHDAVPIFHPEDVGICRESRVLLEQRFGVRIAPEAVACRFSRERGAFRPSFGFHGSFNFPSVLREEIIDFLRDTPDKLFLNRDGRDLCRALVRSGKPYLAAEGRRLARRLVALRPSDRRYWVSWVQAGLWSLGFGRKKDDAAVR